MKTFENLGLSEETLKVLEKRGFEEPTPIQLKTIPAILKSTKDVIGQAQTGTGKTAAFGLPMIELLERKKNTVQAIILTPTRELAIQVAEEINSLKGNNRLSIVPIYGGQSIDLQLRSLKKGVDIVVGTPGRILDHLKRRTLVLDKISFFVLDEADEMLNMGFIDDIKEIMDHTPPKKRIMLFSATMPPEIVKIAKKYMGDYDVLKVTTGQLTVIQTDQIYFEVSGNEKFEALCRIIDMEHEFYALVFCRTKIDVDAIANRLIERGYDADALHGDMSQSMREKILTKFKKQHINILVATDVAARGIDVDNLTHVINYSIPQDPESYIHRIGRTGRAGKEGIAITFITPEEYRKLKFIKREIQTDIRRGKLPKVKDLIEVKKARFKNEIDQIVNSKPRSEYLAMSKEILLNNDPEQTLAALLQYSFKDELSEKKYTEIENTAVDKKGKSRLFVAVGKKDQMTRRKLVDLIVDHCHIKSKNIEDIMILDKFSFITLPFHDAEIVLSYFKKKKSKRGPLVTMAKDK